jgi:hypothetical protein
VDRCPFPGPAVAPVGSTELIQHPAEGGMGSVLELDPVWRPVPKVARQGLRLAFLSPEVTSAILEGDRPLDLKQIPKLLPISWHEQRILDYCCNKIEMSLALQS